MATLIARTSGKSSPRYRGRRTQSVDRESSVLAYVWAFKSNHARLVQYRARKQAADRWDGRLLTRAVLYRCPNFAWPDLDCARGNRGWPRAMTFRKLILLRLTLSSS